MAKPQRRTPSMGHIAFGPERKNQLVAQTVEFICEQLPAWREDPQRPKWVSEKGLNSSLCDFLDVKSRSEFPMIRFKHEAPQAANRTADIGVHGTDDLTEVDAGTYSIYEPFLVVEAKRLPTPGGQNRRREYVSGFHSNGSPAGGIQRFRLGLHGSSVEVGVLIGYIESRTPRYWRQQINAWIRQQTKMVGQDGLCWSKSDNLGPFLRSEPMRASRCSSTHARTSGVSSEIRLHHVWIETNTSHYAN